MPRKNEPLHDWVITKLVNTEAFTGFANTNGYRIATNPDAVQHWRVGPVESPVWPDVVVYDPRTQQQFAKKIGEVETEDTVTLEHGKEQWAEYAKLVQPFILAVPRSSAAAALDIIRHLQIVCELWSYAIAVDSLGNATSVAFSVEKQVASS